MSRSWPRSSVATSQPTRSLSAAQAYAAGDVSYVIDLTQQGAQRRVQQQVRGRTTRAISLLLPLAGGVWLLDTLLLVTRAGTGH